MSVYNAGFGATIATEEDESSKYMLDDLQLAAELGKTLLERNKELETALKQHQNIIEDQAQEIEYLQKQTGALREVNDSRLRIYEQLEIGIQDLERLNHRLTVENTAEKKHSKVLLHNIETLEARCEELTKSVDDLKQSLDVERRKNDRLIQEKNKRNELYNAEACNEGELFNSSIRDTVDSDEVQSSSHNSTASEPLQAGRGTFLRNANSTGTSESMAVDQLDVSHITSEENEELIKLMTELEATKKAYMSEQQRVSELEEQLMTIIQENQNLQNRVAQVSTNEEMKSVHEELSILEEVRQGTMCSRCLRTVDDRNLLEDGSSIAGTEDDEDRSYLELMSNPAESGNTMYHPPATSLKNQSKPSNLDLGASSPNPYRDLVEKYEALLEVQRHNIARRQTPPNLHDELQTSGEFSSMNTKGTDDGSSYMEREKSQPRSTISNAASSTAESNLTASNGLVPAGPDATQKSGKNCRRTPTDFSEAETSSSGFSDETSNKATQTDERRGFFLCSIGDGDDCKFSIYDDVSPIDSRFRNRPEYRELFKEIFAVLKKAAENKEEGDKLPLLDDTHPNVNKVPPVTPANEELPDFGDDTQSIISSVVSEQSVAMSECITKTERKTAAKKHIAEMNQENKPPLVSGSGAGGVCCSEKNHQVQETGRVLTPLKREPLEYLAVSVGVKKKNRKKNRNFNPDRSDSPVLPSPPRVYLASGKKRRDMRPFNVTASMWSSSSSNPNVRPSSLANRAPPTEWNGNSMVIYNRNVQTTIPGEKSTSQGSGELDISQVQFRPSTVSQELHKLKKLDLSYAEVLRRADACKHHHRRK